MKHTPLSELNIATEVPFDRVRPVLGRNERLERWAELLESEPRRQLATLPGTEHVSRGTRAGMRAADSPVSLAYADPVLRGEGLAGDSYGEAKRFFDLSDWQLHNIVCYCHFGETVSAGTAARFVRAAMTRHTGGILGRLTRLFGHFAAR